MLLGLGEGSDVLAELFLDVYELNIGGETFAIRHKNIERASVKCGLDEELYEYEFQTPWFALNQRNFDYYKAIDSTERQEMLNAILRGNILSFFKGVGIWLTERVITSLRVTGEVPLRFKDQTMLGFRAAFTTNALLPRWIGLGKSVGRGFGSVNVQH